MEGNRDFEKTVTGWSALVIVAGLLLIAGQLGAQFYFEYRIAEQKKWESIGAAVAQGPSSYIGLVIFLAGAILMALVILTSRWRAGPGRAVESRLKALETEVGIGAPEKPAAAPDVQAGG